VRGRLVTEGEETRRRIIELTDSLFRKSGVKSIVLDDIAARLGISKKTIYKSFKSKDELIKTVFLEYVDFSVKHLERIIAEETDLFVVMERHILERIKFIREIVPRMEEVRKYYPDLWKFIDGVRMKERERIIEIVKLGIKRKQIRKRVDPKTVMIFIYGVLTNLMEEYSRDESFDIESNLKKMIGCIRYGIGEI